MNTTMKTIEVDEELYRYIASQTHHIGESASDILRRLLLMTEEQQREVVLPVRPKGIVVSKDAGNEPKIDRVATLLAIWILSSRSRPTAKREFCQVKIEIFSSS